MSNIDKHGVGNNAFHSASTLAELNALVSDLIATYGALRDIGIGTAAQRPAAIGSGRLWYATDTGQWSYDSGTWDDLPAVPGAHNTTHQHGGSDEIATATPAANVIPKADGGGKLDTFVSDASTTVKGKVELATDGENAANVAVQGNDSRLSDSRDPNAHASTHVSGGSDEIRAATELLNGLLSASAQNIGGVKTFFAFPITPTAAPTALYEVANKKYVDDSLVGALKYAGGYDATTDPNGSATQGDMYVVTVEGTGVASYWSTILRVGDAIIAEIDNPASEADWTVLERNLDIATETQAGIAEIATSAEVTAQALDDKIVTPAKLASYLHAASHTDGTDDIQDATASQKGLLTAVAQVIAGLKTFNTPIRMPSLNNGDEILTTDLDGDVQESGVKVETAPAGGSGFTVVEYATDPVNPPAGFFWMQALDANTKRFKYYDGVQTYYVDLSV